MTRLKTNFLHRGMYPDFTLRDLLEDYGFPYRFEPRSAEISKDVASVCKEIAERFKEEPRPHLA